MGNLDKLCLRVTQLVDGDLRIMDQHLLPFTGLGGVYQKEILELQKHHAEKFQKRLSFLASSLPVPGAHSLIQSLQLARRRNLLIFVPS